MLYYIYKLERRNIMYNVIEKLVEAKDEVEWEIRWREKLGQYVSAELKLVWSRICELIDELYEM